MAKKTQKDAILEHLKRNGTITSLEAIDLYGATRLSGIIYILKHKEGYNIITEDKKVHTRWGRMTNVAEYRLLENEIRSDC